MTDTTDTQVLLTWNDLKKLGWPYSRTHTRRKEADKIEVAGLHGTEPRIIDNPDPVPKARKLGWHPNSPLVWVRSEILAYLKRHGIDVK